MKRKMLFLAAACIIIGAIISCEQALTFEPTSQNSKSSKSLRMDSEVSYLVDRSFMFGIEGEGDNFSVNIINRLERPTKIVKVTKAMCPYYYKLLVPVEVLDRADISDVEVIATNSCIRHIDGFRDDFGTYCHSDTYHFGVLGPRHTTTLTAIFDMDTDRDIYVPDENEGDITPANFVNVVLEEAVTNGTFRFDVAYTSASGHQEQLLNLQGRVNIGEVKATSTLTISYESSQYNTPVTLKFNNSLRIWTKRVKRGESGNISFDMNLPWNNVTLSITSEP